MNKIKILHTLCRINSGGVEQRRLLLARGLSKDKYENLVICQDTAGILPKLLRTEGWKIIEIGTDRAAAAAVASTFSLYVAPS